MICFAAAKDFSENSEWVIWSWKVSTVLLKSRGDAGVHRKALYYTVLVHPSVKKYKYLEWQMLML